MSAVLLTSLPGVYLGTTRVAHVMRDRGEAWPVPSLRFVSACGLLTGAVLPLEADESVRLCGGCLRATRRRRLAAVSR